VTTASPRLPPCETVHCDPCTAVEEDAVESGGEGLETAGAVETGAPTREVELPATEDEDVEESDVELVRSGGGLSPPAPSSVDPIGIPTRPTGAAATMPVGDEAEAVGRAKAVLAPDMQVPETVPVLPPSKVVANPVVEGVVDPVADEVPVIGAPKDTCGIEPPNPEQTDMSLVARPLGLAPGDVPGIVSSAAPRGIPVGATGGAAPRPSGEVMPSGEGVGAPPPAPT
jgi:hypothetical protein